MALTAGFKKEFADTEPHYAHLLALFRTREHGEDEGGGGLAPLSRVLPTRVTARSLTWQPSMPSAAAPAPLASAAAAAELAAAKLAAAMHAAAVQLAPTTGDAFPLLPQELLAADAALVDEPECLANELCPDGLPHEWWAHFQAYRTRKVRTKQFKA